MVNVARQRATYAEYMAFADTSEIKHEYIAGEVCPGWVRTDVGGPRAPRDVGEGAASIVATVLEPRATGGFFRDGQPIGW